MLHNIYIKVKAAENRNNHMLTSNLDTDCIIYSQIKSMYTQTHV